MTAQNVCWMTSQQTLIMGVVVGFCVSMAILALLWFGVAVNRSIVIYFEGCAGGFSLVGGTIPFIRK